MTVGPARRRCRPLPVAGSTSETTEVSTRPAAAIVTTTGLLLATAAAAAQVVTVPPRALVLAPFATVTDVDLAGRGAGDTLLVWNEDAGTGGDARFVLGTRRLGAAGSPIAAPSRIESRRTFERPSVDVIGTGALAYVAAWSTGARGSPAREVRSVRLDGAGVVVSAETEVDDIRPDNHVYRTKAIGLPSAAVIAWAEFASTISGFAVWSNRYDLAGAKVDFRLLAAAAAPRLDGDATPDGGYVLVLGEPLPGAPTVGVTYDATGAQIGVAFTVHDGSIFHFRRAAVSPRGDVVAAVGVRPFPGAGTGSEVWWRRLAPDGTPLGSEELVAAMPPHPVEPDVAFDANGNALVAWSAGGGAAAHARAYDAAGVPLGPPVPISGTYRAQELRVLAIDVGEFVAAWASGGSVVGTTVSLCEPGTATCGDGVLAPLCEACDDGAGNSDVAPDACRTSCRPARCGDGVVDGGESCDDGNRVDCDGCTASCVAEVGLGCGDGTPFPACGEQCDDANAIAGDGCTADCRAERIPGGGSPGTDCFAVWVADNPANDPLRDRHGDISGLQRCVDGDPRCDFDGGVSGSCTFHVRACANNTAMVGCIAPSRLAAWQVQAPTAAQAARDPAAAALRGTLLGGVPAALVGPATRDVCTDALALAVPLRVRGSGYGPGKRTLKTRAALYTGDHDSDRLRLVCLPGGPP